MTEETNRGENVSEHTRKRFAAMLPTAADKMIFFLGAAAMLGGIIGTRVAQSGWVVFFDNVHWTAAYLTAAALAWLGAFTAEGTDKIIRRYIALGLSANCIGQILWDIQVYTGWNPFPGPSDAFFLMLAPGIIAGYYTAFRSDALQFNKKSVWLDSLILSGCMIIVTFAHYLARRGETPLYQFTVLAAYPIVLLSAAALGVLLILHGRLRLSANQIIFYLSVVTSGWMWLEWNSRTLDGLLADGVWFNTVFSFTTIIMGMGVRHWHLEVSKDKNYGTFCDNVLRYLPLAAVVAACTAIVLSFSIDVPSSIRSLIVFGAGSIVLLAAVRQSVIVMDLRNANAAVEQARLELEQYSTSLERIITEREKTERHRRRQNEILEKTSDLVGSMGKDRRITFLNDAFKKHFGIAENDDVSAFTPWYFHPPDVSEYLAQTAHPYAIEHGIWSGESAIWNKDRTGTIPVSQVILPHYSETGELEWLSTIMRDLSVQKQSEQEIEKQRQFLQGVFQGMSNVGLMVFTVETDGDFRLAGINKWYEDRGVKSENYIEKTLTEIEKLGLLSAATIANTRRRLNLSLEMRREYTEEAELGTTSGYFSTTTIPILNEPDDTVTMIIVTTIDITERKNIEWFLRDIVEQTSSVVGQKFFEAMVEFLAKTLNVKYVFVGKLTEDRTGVQTLAVCTDNSVSVNIRYDLAGTPCANVVEREVCVYNEGVQQLFPADTLLQEMGAESYVGVPLLSSDMTVVGIIVVMDDKQLTNIEFIRSAMSIFAARASSEIDRMDAEDKLRHEKEYIRYIIDSSPALICGIGVNGDTLFVNPALQTVTGYTPEEILGKNWFEIFYPDDEEGQVQRLLTDITARGVLTDYPMELKAKSGETRTILWNGSVVRNSDGGLQHIIGIGNDITEKMRMEANRLRLESLERERRAIELRGALQNIAQLQGAVREIISEIARTTVHVLGGEYVSYWEIHDLGAECLLYYGLHEDKEIESETGQWLYEYQYPQYFAMMRAQEEPFMVPSALFHPIANSSSDRQKVVLHIDEMLLDAPVRIAGNLIGILCINGRNQHNPYSGDELAFVSSVGNLIAYYTEADERRLAAEELRQSEERFARAFLDSPLPMLVVSTEKKHILAINGAWSAAVGYTSEEALGKLPTELGLQSIGERFITELSDMIASGSPVRNYEVFISSKNGAEREYLLSGSLINIGGEQCLLLAQQDITDRKRAEAELRRSEEFMRRILHSIPDAVYVIAMQDFRIIDVNEAFIQINGITRKDIVGKTSREITALVASGELLLATPDTESEIIAQDFRKHLLTEGFVSGGYIVSLRSKSGRYRRVELSGTKVELENGQQCLCIFERDVTERERVAEALRSAKNAAERANRAKSEFLANMSHEIRTPMNAILGFTEILREQVQNNQHRRYLETITTSSKTLLSLINDILDLSKIEAGKMEIQYEQTDIRSLVREVEAIFSLRIHEKSLYFTVNIDSEVPGMLFLDEVRLRQVLFNLVGNAVKFTEQGGIVIRITAEAAMPPPAVNGNGGGRYCDLMLEVRDTGIGIPVEQTARIFEPFQQQEGQSTRKYGGTGLGLTITRRLTEMMNGIIEVESSEAGSTFRVRLFSVRAGDARESIADDIAASDDISMNNMTVMVVDDIAANRELLCSHLEHFGAKFYEAENGLDAIGLVERYRPSAVFMDIRMPVMDGIEATEILKKQEHTRNIPVIAVTASVMASDTERLQRLFDGHINKPFTRNELVTEIRRVLGGILDKPLVSSVDTSADESTPELQNDGNYEALGAELVGEFIERWNEIRKFNRITQIKEFARRLHEQATHFGVSVVANYANALGEACASFDVKNVMALMGQFPDVVKKTTTKN